MLKFNPFTGTFDFVGSGSSIANTDALPEGITNLYFTAERAQDAVGATLTDTADINLLYDDPSNTITATLPSQSLIPGTYGSASLNAVVTVNQRGIVTGISEIAQATPTGTANTLAFFDAIGLLSSLSQWSTTSFGGLNASIVLSEPSSATTFQFSQSGTVAGDSFQYALYNGAVITNSLNQIDLNNGGTVGSSLNQINGYNNGTQQYYRALNFTNDGETFIDAAAALFFQNANVDQNYTGIGVYTNGSLGDVGKNVFIFDTNINGPTNGNFTLLNLYKGSTHDGGLQGLYLNNAGAITGGLTFSTFYNNASIGGDFRFGQFGNDGDIAGSGAGILMSRNGNVARGWTGLGIYCSGNLGTSSDNSYFAQGNFNNGAIAGNIWGFDFNLTNTVTLDAASQVHFLNFNNQATGGYSLSGYSYFNEQNFSESIGPISIFDYGDARTKTGIDVTLRGVVTDDTTGVRINVTGLSSVPQKVNSLNESGGTHNVQSDYNLASGLFVDVGNNMTATAHVLAGFPITGTDNIIQLIQSNLLADDDISTGPIGLDTVMYGLASQVAVASGKTIPLLRTMLLGTTVPMGSGGTISEHVVLELLGLPSFGGSVTNPIRIGIQDAQLVGQNFSDGATDVWFLRVRDTVAENFMQKLAIGTATMKVSASTIGLEIYNKDLHMDTGFLIAGTAGYGVKIKEGTDAKSGTAVLVAGTVTVLNASVTSGSRILPAINADGGVPGDVRVTNIVAGTSFDIVSSSALDTSTVAWFIIEGI